VPTNRPITLVTGAGSGLGLESAVELAARGYQVCGSVLSDDEEIALRSRAGLRGAPIEVVRMDVTHEQEVHAVIDSYVRRMGRIDNVVQFAGLGLRGFFEDLSLQEIRNVYEVNVFGMMAVAQAVIPYMRESRYGRLVFTTSVGGRMGAMSISGYASSKFAIEGLGECLRQELAPFGIHVSLLEPGLVKTPHFTVNRNRARRAIDPASPYYEWFCQHEHLVDRILARNRFGPEEVARQTVRVLDSTSPRLRYVVGAKAKLIFSLRRHLPGELFESVYWSQIRRIVTKSKTPVRTLSGIDSGHAE
jgi:NAD(P)-dependent dehydrogenase (short-subunit alcohol dehydrogenase family)